MSNQIIKALLVSVSLFLFACNEKMPSGASENKKSAEAFLNAIYGCKPEKIDSLADDRIVVSYPIFQELFNKPAISGKKAVKNFATGFCKKWSDPEVTVHRQIEEEDTVVLVWSYKASGIDSETGAKNFSSWGGITYYRFNKDGKIIEEVGEESSPGPIGRLK
jgi:predicted SnoaL-like aldol condensation-catalyzing enzyme